MGSLVLVFVWLALCAPVSRAAGPEQQAVVRVFYESGGEALAATEFARLDEVVALFFTLRDGRIDVSGHADRAGRADKNLVLSQRRAAAVAAYLASRGVPASVVTAVGFGETRPFVPTQDGKSEVLNRRVELILFGVPSELEHEAWGQ